MIGLLPALGACFVDALGERGAGGTGGATSTGSESTASLSVTSTTSTTSGGTTSASTTTSATTTGAGGGETGGGGAGGGSPCPLDWTLGFESCYRVIPPDDPDGATRDEAIGLCVAAGNAVGGTARLATPNVTPDIALLESLGGASFDVWTGAKYDNNAQNKFVWEGSGEAFVFMPNQAPWGPNQPDNMPGESCVIVVGGELHTYECYDFDFSQPFAAGCELVP